MRLARLALALLALAAFPAHAADRDAAVLAAARSVIAPRLDALAAATERQARAWAAGCADAERLRAAYRAAADAWSAVEFVRYGPVMEADRLERMAHWPDRQNAVARALARLLSGDDAVLAPERLARTSTAGQGLSALERLLFEGDGPAEPRRCAVGRAVAAGLARNAAEQREGWRRPGGVLDALSADAEVRREAATRLATELLAFLESIADQKLGAPMGRAPDLARPTLAEGWRAGRSLDAIRVNLDGLAALAGALVDPATEEGRVLQGALATARSVAAGLGGPVGTLAERVETRRDFVLLRDAAKSAGEVAAPALAGALDVTIGFNSRDGD